MGFREKSIRPIPVGDLVDVAVAAARGQLTRATVAVTGAEELMLSEAFRRVGRVVGKRVWVTAAPVASDLPTGLRPATMFTGEEIQRALPQPGGFGWSDLRVAGSRKDHDGSI